MTNPKHTIRRGSTYSFKFNIPADVREQFDGKSQYVEALGTDSPSQAGVKALELYAEWNARIEDARRAGITVEVLPLDMEVFETLSRSDLEYGRDQLQQADEALEAQLTADRFDDPSILASKLNSRVMKASVKGSPSQFEIRKSLSKARNEIADAVAIIDAELDTGLAPYVREEIADILKHARRLTAAFAQESKGTKRVTVRELVDERIADESPSKDILRKVRYSLESLLGCKEDSWNDCFVDEWFTREKAREWKQRVGKGKTYSTVKGYLVQLNNFSRRALNHGYIDVNPFAGLKIVETECEAGRATDVIYSDSEWNTLVELTRAEGKRKAANSYGVAVRLAAYVGCRIGEAGGLCGNNIIEIGDVLCFSIEDAKNESSNRTLPFPQIALEDAELMQLVEAVRGTDKMVFNVKKDLSHKASMQKGASNWFSSEMKAKRMAESGAFEDLEHKVCHTLRDTFCSRFEIHDLPTKDSQEITGHARSDMSAIHRGYVSKPSDVRLMKKWKKQMDKLYA